MVKPRVTERKRRENLEERDRGNKKNVAVMIVLPPLNFQVFVQNGSYTLYIV